MIRSLNRATAMRIALVAAAALSVTACATKKPMPIVKQPEVTQPPPRTEPPRVQQPVTQQPLTSAPVPGSQNDFVVNIGDRVYFDTDSHDVREDAKGILTAQANWLRQYSAVRVRIEGNADERGTREYNLALGARRANSIRDFLVAAGVTGDRISTISFGKEQPIDPGTDEAAWQKNRNGRTAIVSGAR